MVLLHKNFENIQLAQYEFTLDDKPLIEKELVGSKIISERKHSSINTVELNLENGIKIYLKPTKNEINSFKFEAQSLGGYSHASLEDYHSAKSAEDLINEWIGFGSFSRSEIKNKIGIECLIETALGMSNIKEIAKSSSRLEALHFGVADYAASLRARTIVIGGLNPDYPGDQWHHGLSQLVMTCRAYGLRAIDGPFGDFKDSDAYIASAKRAAAIGIEGKWAIHPSQIDLANEVFSPQKAEVDRAKKILEELDKAAKEGKGAAQLDGRMIDAASARMAENIVNINKLIESK